MIENGIDFSKCSTLPIEPPTELTSEEKVLYRDLYDKLAKLGQTCDLDVDNVVQYCKVIYRLKVLDEMLEGADALIDRNIRTAQKQYFEQYLKLSDRLYLNPASRIKSNNQQDKKTKKPVDPLLEALRATN